MLWFGGDGVMKLLRVEGIGGPGGLWWVKLKTLEVARNQF